MPGAALSGALVRRGIGQRKGEDVLHPRLVRGRYLETEPHVNTAYSGGLVCSVMNTSAEF
jgi:hypothetical protein